MEYIVDDSVEELPWKAVISVEEKENRFVKLIYFLTQFLDGKEINELLCTLINKFENIADLTKLVKANNDKVVYSPEFKVFESSTRLARSLKVVKNFARMKIDKVNISMDTLVDAINMLNITKPIKKFNENKIDFYLDDLNNKNYDSNYQFSITRI